MKSTSAVPYSILTLLSAVQLPYAQGATAVNPQVSGTPQLLANVTDPSVSRDSCGSVKIGNRALWTCRDTEPYNVTSGQSQLPLVPNTASWTDFNSDGTPKIQSGAAKGAGSSGSNDVLLMYGGSPTSYPAFYPVLSDECPDSGVCSDGTRYAIWPDSPPLVTNTAADGTVTAYTWINQNHINGLSPVTEPQPFTLYKFTFTPPSADSDTLPSVSSVDETFWTAGQWGFGDYGNVVQDGIAYLWAQNYNDTGVALAKVPVASIEDKSDYEYYVGGEWTSTMPALGDSSAFIANAGAGRQGTFYYSDHFSSYIWIGQGGLGVTADFYITTAPDPQGPWVEPYVIYSGENGDGPIGSYSLQAHPDLLSSTSENAIYLTWTQQFQSSTYGAYVTPLVYVQFQ